ncbi:MAG: hypothetical protein F6K19_50655, partial [Cyanothece sp. SIO1E1]|nr:hypothetical protein [Cyanothece sp. SIO1E1]
GILSNPLFTLANDSIVNTPMLQATLTPVGQPKVVLELEAAPDGQQLTQLDDGSSLVE